MQFLRIATVAQGKPPPPPRPSPGPLAHLVQRVHDLAGEVCDGHALVVASLHDRQQLRDADGAVTVGVQHLEHQL